MGRTVSGVVISLCDYTGNFAKPWVQAGHEAVLVDPQHLQSHTFDRVTHLPGTVEDVLGTLAELIATRRVVFVAGFPPCTDLAVSGARWFESKRQTDPLFQARAVAVAEQCRTVGRLSGAPWLVENPVSVLSQVFGPADHSFHPYEFTGYEPGDNYTKRTNLWTGGGFVMPAPNRDVSLGEPDDRIHKASPSEDRSNFRSATPMGFARAVYEANRPG